MEKLTASSPETRSEDLVAENLTQLRTVFPDAFTEGKVDFDVLRQLLGDQIDDREEKFGLNWHGKRLARRLALTPSTGTLLPCPVESVDWATTQNLMIEGDNLEVLKLLQKSYSGKIKVIYIDPPYNTGKDFVYPDDFQDNIKNYLTRTKQTEGGCKTTSNTESNGRFHTDWLNMIYPRLKLAHNLLRDDGVIFISIDDSEQEHLKNICNEIFGEENFINTISINMKNIAGASGGGEDKKLKKNIEYLHIYAKNYDIFPSFENVYNFIPINELVEQYREEGVSWKYTSVLYSEGIKSYIGSTVDGDGNEIKIFSRQDPVFKSINQIVREEGISEGEVYIKYAKQIFQTAMPQSSIRPRVMEKVQSLGLEFDLYSIEYVPRSGKNKGAVYEQFYKGDSFRLFAWLSDVSEMKDGILYKKDLQGTYWDYAAETKNLTKEGEVPLPNGKKPLALLMRLLELDSDKNSIVLDFFAGSGTTGHAVVKMNESDGGNRKFILVQLPEAIDPENKDQKASAEFLSELNKPLTIAELTKERLRRVATKTKAENPMFAGDIGFRVFKLNASNIRTWEPQLDDLSGTLLAAIEHVREGRTEDDILFELLLKLGLELTVPIEQKLISGKKVQSIGGGVLLVCLDPEIGAKDYEPLALGIASWYKELAPAGETSLVFLDSAFTDDVAKTNLTATLSQYGLDNIRSL